MSSIRELHYEEATNMNHKVDEFKHDNPDHPWHWSRKNPPCPLLSTKNDCKGDSYGDLYHKFHDDGYVVFTSCSLNASILDPVATYTARIKEDRQSNVNNKDIKALSVDLDTLEFLEFLHGGRRAFPFQTLNFPRGTQQPLHSDLIHFDSMPRTLMAASWVALEDMNHDNGPLRFFPKSHQFGTWDYDEIGLHHKYKNTRNGAEENRIMTKYGEELEIAMKKAGLEEARASDMKRGQTLFWAAGLVHGGSKQNNMNLSRLSQVTHYYFEGFEYHWVPRLSDRSVGDIRYRTDNVVSCSNQFLGTADGSSQIHSCADGEIERWVHLNSEGLKKRRPLSRN